MVATHTACCSFDNRSFYLHFDSFFGGFSQSALVDRSPSRVQLQEAQDKKDKKMANHEDGMTKVCPAIQSKSGVTRKGRESAGLCPPTSDWSAAPCLFSCWWVLFDLISA